MKKIFPFITALVLSVSLFAQSSKQYHVEIVRDSFGVPHIFGKTDADCAYGLVYAACEDDFNTVQWGLLLARGKLGLMMGIEGVKIDYAVQLLGVPDFIKSHYETDLSPETRALLEAGAAAGNDYVKKHPERIVSKSLLPIQPTDFIAGYMMSMALMTGVDKALTEVVGGSVPTLDYNKNARGSNALAMDSNITADGNVYLDVNAHQPLQGPMSWYEAHLHSDEGLNIIGSTFHGAVSIFHGVNENLGWAHTTNYFDAIDVYQLQPDPKKKNHYLVDGVSYPLEVSTAHLTVNLAKHRDKHKFILSIGKKKWWSIYGATYINKKGMFAIRLASNMTIKSVEEWYKMNKARNFTEFRNAIGMEGIVNQNITYADKYDTIYCVSNGAMPLRADGYNWKSTVPGNTKKTLWTQFLPYDSLPQVLCPKSGYVFNTNNTAYSMTDSAENPVPLRIQKNVSYETNQTNRSLRFYEMIKNYKKVSWNDFLKIKYDIHYPQTVIAPFKHFDMEDIFHLSEKDHPDIADAIHIIKQWGVNREGSIADTNATLVYRFLYNSYFHINDSMDMLFARDRDAKIQYFVKGIKQVKEDMLHDYGKLNVPLGDYQRHVRGNISLPTNGGPDMWDAKYGHNIGNGQIAVDAGDSYVLLARFTKDGPVIRTINAYGSSNTPGAEHYTDQMQLYVHEKTKEESLSKDWAYKHAERIYHPNE
ncbi:MAG TPA: penicillin acylase family protein [Chitinophagales bacterium]|nr:penicillin acylase family protein [Chitinophagales bacterium]